MPIQGSAQWAHSHQEAAVAVQALYVSVTQEEAKVVDLQATLPHLLHERTAPSSHLIKIQNVIIIDRLRQDEKSKETMVLTGVERS